MGRYQMKKSKPIQHPDYEKAPMDRRQFIRRIATAGGVTSALGYVALAPASWRGSIRDTDAPGLRSMPHHISQRLKDFRVPKPAGAFDIGLARKAGTPKEKLRRAIDAIGGIEHYIKPGDIVLIKRTWRSIVRRISVRPRTLSSCGI